MEVAMDEVLKQNKLLEATVCYTGDIDMTTYDRMLVEEFDGYTWRRILGRAPLPGRECMNVTIIDTIPYELEFHHWVDSTALKNDRGEKIQATYTPAPAGTKAFSGIIKWTAPSMLVGEKDKLVYVCVARDMGCPDIDDVYYSNVAWISSDTDSPDSSPVPPSPPVHNLQIVDQAAQVCC